jgi:hypothetical protein
MRTGGLAAAYVVRSALQSRQKLRTSYLWLIAVLGVVILASMTVLVLYGQR